MERGYAGRACRWCAAALMLAAALCMTALAQSAYADEGVKDIVEGTALSGDAMCGASAFALGDDASEPEARWEADGKVEEGTFAECYRQMLVSDSGTITLLRDVSYLGYMPLFEEQSLVLDLNGFTLEAEAGTCALALLDNAHMTVRDGAGGGVFRLSDDSEGYLVYLYSGSPSFALEGGTLSTGSTRTVVSNCDATVSIAGGTATSASDCTVGMWEGTLNVSGGRIANTGSWEAVYLHPLYGAHAFVSGGTFEAAAYPALTVKGTSTLNLSGEPTFSGKAPDSDEPCGLIVGGTVVANDGGDPASPYRGGHVAFAPADGTAAGTTLIDGIDAANANRFRLVGSADSAIVSDGARLLLADSDDPRVVALNNLARAVDAPAENLSDLRGLAAQAASLAADPALAPQRLLLSDGQQAVLAEREEALAAIDAFEAAMAALPAADDTGARIALEAAQAAFAAIPEDCRGAAFVPAADIESLAAYAKAVAEAEKPVPDPKPRPERGTAPVATDAVPEKLAATGDPLGAVAGPACLAFAVAGIALASIRRLRA